MFAFNSIPKIYLTDWSDSDNKVWISDLKQVKEDDIITNTHLNPELTKYSFLKLDGSRIESRDIQKKETILHLFDTELNIRSLLLNEKDGTILSSFAEQDYRFKVISNIAPHFGLPNFSYDLKYQLTPLPAAYHYSTASYRATALLLESHALQKVFVTNIHPNYMLMGHNFTKVTTFIADFNRNLAIVVSSEPELLTAIKCILRNERHKQSGFVYVYYDRLSYSKIKGEDIEESCIVFEHGLKMQVNNLLKRELNFN